MDKLKINKAQSEDNRSKYARNQKQLAKSKKAFIKLDDENIRRCMKYEAKILKFKTEKEGLEAGDISIRQSKKKALEKVGSQNSNATLRAPSSVKGKENAHKT